MPAEDARQLGVERLLFLGSLTSRPNGPAAVQIAAAMRDLHYEREQRLFAIGDASPDVFFVVSGSVRMTAPDAAPWTFEAPAVIGALDAFAGRPRTRTAVATSDVHALALAHTDWLVVLEEHFDFARETLLRIAGSLERMHLGLADDGGYPPPTRAEGPIAAGQNLLDKTRALRRLPSFREAGVQAALRLAELADERLLAPGEALFREGDPCDTLDAVVGGLLEIERAEPPLRAAFGPGSLVGGAATIAVQRAAFTARAAEASLVLRMRKDDVFDVMEDHFALTRAILASVNDERSALMARHGNVDDRAGLGSHAGPASVGPASSAVRR